MADRSALAASSPEPLDRRDFDPARLLTDHPPRWRDRNKRIVFAIACPPGSTYGGGRLRYSRWPAFRLPGEFDVAAALERVEARAGFYDYAAGDGVGGVDWHVNFADPTLFVAYGSSLFAQDEMQVVEHPVLGALKEALDAAGATALTVEGLRPTPILVAGVERRCRVATEASPREGRPGGLYGNAFARAPEAAVRRATTRLVPPTRSNIIAIAAPTGSGRYTRQQIRYVLEAAHSGFGAAVVDSARSPGQPARVVVHSGFWGCGAFGGNRVLMLLVQMAAAACSGVDRLVLHLGDAGNLAFDQARDALTRIGPGGCTTPRFIDAVVDLGFTWGASDGN